MNFITIVFLVYSFIAFYFLFLFILTYYKNKKNFHKVPPVTKEYSLSIVVPCYNEGKHIERTIKSLFNAGYKNLKKVIVVDDCSKDDSFKIVKKLEKKYPNLLCVQTPKNTGCAAGSKNYGAKFVDTELIGFTDGDSIVEKGAIEKTIGFFDDKEVGAVTATVLVHNRNNFILRLQSIEYKVIKFSRKLLEFLDSIYVTPGPLGIYRKSAFDKVNGFDEKNITEDIEITWNLQYHGYKIKMAVPARAYAVSPPTIGEWIKQRNRWNIGGLQTINKYKGTFLRKNTLGSFILPFFICSWLLGLFGIGILFYRIIRSVTIKYLSASFSVQTQTAIFSMNDISLTTNFLMLFGLVVFSFSLWYTIIALLNVREKQYKMENFLTIGFYMIFYLLAYPMILISSLYKFLKGDIKW